MFDVLFVRQEKVMLFEVSHGVPAVMAYLSRREIRY